MLTFKKFLNILSQKERRNAIALLIMIIIMAILDMIGVASILPFMAVLTNPDLIETNLFLGFIFETSTSIGIENNQQFLFLLGVIVFTLLIFSLIFKSFTTYFQVRFIQMSEYNVSKKLIEGYLNQPFSWYLSQNSADLGKTILSEVQQVILNGLSPLIELIAKGMISISLIILLILIDPKLSLIVGFSLTASYALIFSFIRSYLNRIGNRRLTNNQIRFTTVNEAFNAIKEIKVGGLESVYINKFSNSAKIFAQTQAASQAIAQLPRYLLEAIAFGGILLIILYIMSKTSDFTSALPIASLYVFAGYRLMPALQHMYVSFTQLTFIKPSLDKLYEDSKKIKIYKIKNDQTTIHINNQIKLNNIYYQYPNSSRIALKNISLTIPAKKTVGIVGATGSGKTTLINIILGLLEPKQGSLQVDEKIINRLNSRSWQKSIGYVPQNIYLSDDTIASNIAFGVEKNKIDNDFVLKSSKIANLHEFIDCELPNKYQTTIGERGIRLSGGQRQRIGIARALYHEPQVLILDEATSSLDNETEKAVMDAVNNMSKEITIIMIAHRLNTVKNCDIIFKFQNGELVNQGTFEELLN